MKKPKQMTKKEIATFKAMSSAATKALLEHLAKHGTLQAPKKGGK